MGQFWLHVDRCVDKVFCCITCNCQGAAQGFKQLGRQPKRGLSKLFSGRNQGERHGNAGDAKQGARQPDRRGIHWKWEEHEQQRSCWRGLQQQKGSQEHCTGSRFATSFSRLAKVRPLAFFTLLHGLPKHSFHAEMVKMTQRGHKSTCMHAPMCSVARQSGLTGSRGLQDRCSAAAAGKKFQCAGGGCGHGVAEGPFCRTGAQPVRLPDDSGQHQ